MTWYGRGPAETYIDRAFERVGVYSSTVATSGWSTRGRRRTATRPTCGGWSSPTTRASACAPRGCRCCRVEARHASRRDVEQAAYTWQITPRPQVYLNLDFKQMGVGGIDSWSRPGVPDGAVPHPGQPAVLVLVPAAADRGDDRSWQWRQPASGAPPRVSPCGCPLGVRSAASYLPNRSCSPPR